MPMWGPDPPPIDNSVRFHKVLAHYFASLAQLVAP
jgi:hypothetical protein